ncbi:cell cycle checkpoint protein RAD17 [Protopterus annectens]|uniref:cell cycle checkpoint protein RAD17 n=1 Tax=Protopterus annectens TaxID=7888 RepID=UPI001CF9EEC1|nr:cell cycle checkpoint protein RAD17 [Protopterus annectens]
MSKTSLGRKIISAKITNWVEPSFDDLFGSSDFAPASHTTKSSRVSNRGGKSQVHTISSSSKSQATKRAKYFSADEPSDKSRLNHSEPWVDKYRPETQVELAVHKKKIEEVEAWLKLHSLSRQLKQGGSLLLLTGPAGSGKTATLRVLSKELGIQVQEWVNPLSSEFQKDDFREVFDTESHFRNFSNECQTTVFQDFLLRANKYNKLQMLGDTLDTDKKLILIEDLPNQFYRDPSCLHDILRKFVRSGKCPLIFIISDSVSGNNNQRLLFPKDIQDDLGIATISFNPVAPTSMMKVLNRIVAQEMSRNMGKFLAPDKEYLELLCTGSSGDIRSAINSLQFSRLQGYSLEKRMWCSKKERKSSLKASSSSSKSKAQETSVKSTGESEVFQAIGGKDSSLFIFRALGKILYCKREPREVCKSPCLPASLSEYERDPLLVNPEEVIEKSQVSGELFHLYLHQNYLDFFTEIDDVVRASDYLSTSDFLTAEWSSRSTMKEYSASVAARGLIFSNTDRALANSHSRVGFKPLHKPQWLSVNKKYRENCLAAKCLFSNFCLPPVCLQTQLLPYLALLTSPMQNPAQIAFIQDVGCLPLKRYSTRLKLEALTDKDTGTIDVDSDDDFATCESERRCKNTMISDALSRESETAHVPLPSIPATESDLPGSQPQPTVAQAVMEEEEIVIEDYDSD